MIVISRTCFKTSFLSLHNITAFNFRDLFVANKRKSTVGSHITRCSETVLHCIDRCHYANECFRILSAKYYTANYRRASHIKAAGNTGRTDRYDTCNNRKNRKIQHRRQ